MVKIDLLQNKDLDNVLEIQHASYPLAFHEEKQVFRLRIELFPQGCIGAWLDEKLVGYCFSHPWILNKEVSLHHTELSLPPNPECLYIHDMAIHPNFQKRGVGTQLWTQILQKSRKLGFSNISLVAVIGAETIWKHFGFEAIESFRYIADYNGTYMIRKDQ